ncbi:metal-dependent transcriptional regulator [Acetivibrio cellulolyticus]|uniref:metal-dependent transcriptional regulator n=1 Tax=Acetivibrio cellulolyticus TaxID=35830 RepID=UPI0001E2F084|nr:DtxR family transcriptional regulator [Acetivibrio cellulolyticus]
MSEKILSSSMQDYLEAILELSEEEAAVRITDIASKLNIAKSSVNQTISKLKDMGLVSQQVYGPVELTESGREYAKKVKQRHIRLKKFLVKTLGVDPEIAEKDACQMEHAVSSQTMDRLTEFLCRNGYMAEECNINDRHCSVCSKLEVADEKKSGSMNVEAGTKKLSELKIGQRCKVVKVSSKGAVRRRIMEMGITPGAEMLVKGFAPLGDPMEFGIKGYSLSLRKSEAADIIVEIT